MKKTINFLLHVAKNGVNKFHKHILHKDQSQVCLNELSVYLILHIGIFQLIFTRRTII